MANNPEIKDTSEYVDDISADGLDDDSFIRLSPRSNSPSPMQSDPEDEEGFDKRFLQPVKYFDELDDLGRRVYDRSVFSLLIDGKEHRPFRDGHIEFDAPFLENASFQQCKKEDIMRFCREHADGPNSEAPYLASRAHYFPKAIYQGQLAPLAHLIECRNIISAVWENIKDMTAALYCGDFISLLVLDGSRHGVAKLVRIGCGLIERLAIAFETCLYGVLCRTPAMISFDLDTTCLTVLLNTGLYTTGMDSQDLWRFTVHVLDMAVLSYAGAHTQYLGDESNTSVSIPGSFLETQNFTFSRRPFACLSAFLGGQEAWVLDLFHKPIASLPPLCLSTDAVTFGDIWGPMWKSCIVGREDQIIQYNVGNGVIIPWNQPTTLEDAIEVQRDEVLCHWMSDEDASNIEFGINRSALQVGDIMLIGAVKLDENHPCEASTAQHKQRLMNFGSLTEPGTMKRGRKLDSVTIQAQVTPPSMGLGVSRQYKIRGRSMKKSLIQEWKNSPSKRHVGILEFKLGIEVSSCTLNARRIMLIELFGTKTMLNHLQNISIPWSSIECKEGFYSALRSTDKTAFRKLYKSKPEWQTDFGNAIDCCFDALKETGKVENDLVLFWAPDAEPGLKVTLKSDELSWIGFLEDNETSGSLAVLEERCLELPDPDIGRKCMGKPTDLTSTGSGLRTWIYERSILETKVFLNESSVPKSLRGARVKSRRHDGNIPEYPWRWSLLSLREGDNFYFGDKGALGTIKQLHQGQILAKWAESSDVMRHLQSMSSKIPVLGKVVNPPPSNVHNELIRNNKEDTCPISFIILSTTVTKTQNRQCHYETSISGPPREFTAQERTGLHRWVQNSEILVNGQGSSRDSGDGAAN